MAKIETLNNELHRNKRITTSTDVSTLENQNILPLVLAEFPQASIVFPICFIQKPESEGYQAVALLGIEQDENLFVEDSKWDATYMPARFTHAPFGLIKNPEDETQFALAFDSESHLVSETDGQRLFNDDGTESEYLVKQKEAMSKYMEQEHLTTMFIKELDDAGLLVTRSLGITVGDRKIGIDGITMVDEEKLNGLSDEDFLKIRNKGLLPSIYSHMLSMRQVTNMLQRKTRREEQKNKAA